MSNLYTIEREFRSSLEERGSTFLGFLIPWREFERRLEELRGEHPKAVHFVSASRHLNEYGQIEESFSDDGEPKGTSGMPTLKVLRGYELINAALISVRYFGGTLLGTGGLVRAYTQSAKSAIEAAILLPYQPSKQESLEIEYAILQRAEYRASKRGLALHKHDFLNVGVRCEVEGEAAQVEEFLKEFK